MVLIVLLVYDTIYSVKYTKEDNIMYLKVSESLKALIWKIVDEAIDRALGEFLAEAEEFDEEFREYSSQERYYRFRTAADCVQEYVERTEAKITRKTTKRVLKKYPRFTRILCAIIMGFLILLFEAAAGHFAERKDSEALCTIEYSEKEKVMSVDIYERGGGSFTIEGGNTYNFCFQ